MNYERLTNEELNKCRYPNLIAEILESGYSTSTLADFMGLGAKKNGKYRPEGDLEVWDKINGKEDICTSHVEGLCKYYGLDNDYLFSDKLYVVSGKSLAYWRWYDKHRKEEEELKKAEEIRAIEHELHIRHDFFEFAKLAMTLSEDQLQLATKTIDSLAG
ncbi:MAG: hypothetical protein ACI4DR_03550 [Roseburia sp.]